MSAGEATREFPDAPRVGVGAVVLDGERVLLVKRGRPPLAGKWSLPGGLVRLGERLEAAVLREIEEECGLRVRLLGLCGVVDRVRLSAEGAPTEGPRVQYHWVLVDYAAEVVDGTARAGSDAADLCWVRVSELAQWDTTDGVADMVERALRVRDGSSR